MIIIAHRGNLNGPSKNENSLDHIGRALKAGFEVEIDVWFKNNFFYLGHDFPEYRLDHNDITLLENSKSWVE